MNVIVIHAESLQTMALDKSFNKEDLILLVKELINAEITNQEYLEEYQELLKYIPKENEKTTKPKPNRVVSGKLTNLNVLFTVLAIIFLFMGSPTFRTKIK